MTHLEIRAAVMQISRLTNIVTALCQQNDPVAAHAYDKLVNSAIDRLKTAIVASMPPMANT